MLPFIMDETAVDTTQDNPYGFENGDFVFIPDVKKAVEEKAEVIKGYIVNKGMKEISLNLGELTDDERTIITSGCLINYYREH